MLVRLLIVTLSLLFYSTCCYAGQSANEFWRDFRQAILNGETTAVASMTKFPLWVRGPDDSDPVYYYKQSEFLPIYRRLLNQRISIWKDDTVVSKTMYQVIKEKKQLDAQDLDSDKLLSVENFEFQVVNGRWLFTRGYLEDAGGR